MTYKALKREQLDSFKLQKKYKEMIQAIKEAELTAFGDIRNLLFEREIGTNLLTEFATAKRAEELLDIMRQI